MPPSPGDDNVSVRGITALWQEAVAQTGPQIGVSISRGTPVLRPTLRCMEGDSRAVIGGIAGMLVSPRFTDLSAR